MLRSNLYNVMTNGNKEVLVNFRLRPDVRDEFKAVAELRGSTMSNILHQYAIKLIREERERDPKGFAKMVASVKEAEELSKMASPSEQPVDDRTTAALMTNGIHSKGKSEARDAEHFEPLLEETRAQRKRIQASKKSSKKRKPPK